MSKGSPRLVWYARALDIVRMGPYDTQAEAAAATFGLNGSPAPSAFVWPEVVKE